MWSADNFPAKSSLISAQEDGKKLSNALAGDVLYDHIRIVRPQGLDPKSLQSLSKQTNLKELELEFVPIKSSNIEALTQAITHSPLTTLILAQMPMPPQCIDQLYLAVKGHRTLTSLALKSMHLRTEHLENIKALINEGNLTSLDLRFNRFSDQDKEYLYNMVIESSRLESFKLDRCIPEVVQNHLQKNAEMNNHFRAIQDVINELNKVGPNDSLSFEKCEKTAKEHFDAIETNPNHDTQRLQAAKIFFYQVLGRAFAAKQKLSQSADSLKLSLNMSTEQQLPSLQTKRVLFAVERVQAGKITQGRLDQILKQTSATYPAKHLKFSSTTASRRLDETLSKNSDRDSQVQYSRHNIFQ